MKVNANDLRVGHIIEHEGRLLQVESRETTKPGKGGAYLQATVRDVETGNKDNLRFRTQESVERVRLEQMPFQFLFKDDYIYTFMNTESYEQITIAEEFIGEQRQYIKDGMDVEIEFYEGKPLTVKFPDTAVYTVEQADPVIKGQTVSSSYKPALINGGVNVMVPQHIEAGTDIVVRIETGEYLEKAKS